MREQAPCSRCRHDPDQRVGPDACPLNAMYWDCLNTHRVRFSSNLRVRQQLTTLDRFGPEQVKAISQTAAAHRRTLMPLAPGWDFDDDAG